MKYGPSGWNASWNQTAYSTEMNSIITPGHQVKVCKQHSQIGTLFQPSYIIRIMNGKATYTVLVQAICQCLHMVCPVVNDYNS